MKIKLLAFATASDLLGRGPTEVELPDGARVSDLKRLLVGQHPKLETMWPRLAIAVEGKLVQGNPELVDGQEVAMLPPVSGGKRTDSPIADLTDGPIDVAAVERAVASDHCGAVLLFLGNVRNHHADRPVKLLTYSSYRRMAQETLERIVTEIEASSPGLRLAIVHRLGHVPVGESSVVIAAASAHREAAYGASRLALERLKKEVPIWKREHYSDGELAWREEESLADSADRT